MKGEIHNALVIQFHLNHVINEVDIVKVIHVLKNSATSYKKACIDLCKELGYPFVWNGYSAHYKGLILKDVSNIPQTIMELGVAQDMMKHLYNNNQALNLMCTTTGEDLIMVGKTSFAT